MTKGSVGLFEKKDGEQEVRIYFPTFTLTSGQVLEHVTLFPHPCGTCVGGDHTHVEVFDVRQPTLWLKRDCVELAPLHRTMINEYLKVKLLLWEQTLQMHEAYVVPHAGDLPRKTGVHHHHHKHGA